MLSLCVTAQESKPGASARPAEQKEIAADNHLKRSIQQKQLVASPERIADSSQIPMRKDVKKKKGKCRTKALNKA
jgi:hypothetical protein